MLRGMITGAGFHYDYAPAEDGTMTATWKELTAEQHPHPLVAAADSPECCKAVADWETEGGDPSAVIQEAAKANPGAGAKLYLAPGTFTRPDPTP